MTEFIPIIPSDHEPRPEEREREFWDGAVRALEKLAHVADQMETEEFGGSLGFDLDYELTEMAKEDEESARDQLFGFATMLTVPDHTSSELEEVWDFLEEYGIIEPDE
jgi:hypothetical protein